MTSENQKVDKARKRRFKSKWVKAVGIFEVTWLLSAIAIFITAAAITGKDFDLGFKLAGIGGIVFGSMVGSLFVIIISGTIISAIRTKKSAVIASPYLPDGSLVSYTTDYKADTKSKTRKTYRCKYCGFKVDRNASECPKCGGSID